MSQGGVESLQTAWRTGPSALLHADIGKAKFQRKLSWDISGTRVSEGWAAGSSPPWLLELVGQHIPYLSGCGFISQKALLAAFQSGFVSVDPSSFGDQWF